MSYDRALLLAVNKLKWQVPNGYRKGFNDEDVGYYADEIYILHNTFKGRG